LAIVFGALIGVVAHLLAELWQYLSICWKWKKIEVDSRGY